MITHQARQMKKLLNKILALALLVCLIPNNVLASANTHSTDLESGSSQYWSITDASQTGLDITGDFSIEGWVKLESLNISFN